LRFVAKNGLANGLFKTKDFFGTGTKLINVIDAYQNNYLVDYPSLDRVQTEPHERELYSAKSGDIFFVRSSLKLEGVAASVCLMNPPEETVFECHLVRIRPEQTQVLPQYLIKYLNSSLIRQRLIALAETTTMTTIAQPKLASLEVIVPPLEEQRAIAAYLDQETAKLDALVGKVEAVIERLQEYRAALIAAAVTGQVDVRAVRTPGEE
jgi:type I restriction enzyme, S subunit